MHVLVTGGAGYVGSHACVSLLDAGHEVVVIDDFSNSEEGVLDTVRELTGKSFEWVKADIRNRAAVSLVLERGSYDAVMHFAALKSVPESIVHPARYWDVNVGGMSILLEAALAVGVKRFIFSSSAMVYGEQKEIPISEKALTAALNPYASTKLAGERMLHETALANPEFQVCNLRYFNPIGSHPSGRLGENPRAKSTNLFPAIVAACRSRTGIEIHGTDYETPDGSAIRDFIHVMDLAEGHIAALEFLMHDSSVTSDGAWTFNLGTGKGCSVLELIGLAEKAAGHSIPLRFAPRRQGDVQVLVANAGRAASLLGWRASRTLADACAHALRAPAEKAPRRG